MYIHVLFYICIDTFYVCPPVCVCMCMWVPACMCVCNYVCMYTYICADVSLTTCTIRYLRSLLLLTVLPPVVGTSHDPNKCLDEIIQVSKSIQSNYITLHCSIMYYMLSCS